MFTTQFTRGTGAVDCSKEPNLILSTGRPTVDVSWGDDELTLAAGLGSFGNANAAWRDDTLTAKLRRILGVFNATLAETRFASALTLSAGRPTANIAWRDDTLVATAHLGAFGALNATWTDDKLTSRLAEAFGSTQLAWQGDRLLATAMLGPFGAADLTWTTDSLKATAALRFGTADLTWRDDLLRSTLAEDFGATGIAWTGDKLIATAHLGANSGRFGLLDATWRDDKLKATVDEDFGAAAAVGTSARLVQLFLWGNETPVTTGFTNPANAKGKPDDTVATSSTDASEDELQLLAGAPALLEMEGFTWIPELTQVAWDYATSLAVGVGENYDMYFRAGASGTERAIETSITAAQTFSTSYGGSRMISDNTNIRTDINALAATEAGLLDFVNESRSRWVHQKAAVGNVGGMSIDAKTYSMWLYGGGSKPNITTMTDFVAGDWNTDGELGSVNNRFENTTPAINNAGEGIRKTLTAGSFMALFRFGGARQVTGNKIVAFRWHKDTETLDTAVLWALHFIIAASSADDTVTWGRDPADESASFPPSDATTVTPSGGWTAGGTVGLVGNWMLMRFTPRTLRIGHLYLARLRGPGDWEVLINAEKTLTADISGGTSGYFGAAMLATVTQASPWLDDLFIFNY